MGGLEGRAKSNESERESFFLIVRIKEGREELGLRSKHGLERAFIILRGSVESLEGSDESFFLRGTMSSSSPKMESLGEIGEPSSDAKKPLEVGKEGRLRSVSSRTERDTEDPSERTEDSKVPRIQGNSDRPSIG